MGHVYDFGCLEPRGWRQLIGDIDNLLEQHNTARPSGALQNDRPLFEKAGQDSLFIP